MLFRSPRSDSVAIRSANLPTGERARAGEAPPVDLDGRIGLLEGQVMVLHQELRASREEMRNLIQAIKTSQGLSEGRDAHRDVGVRVDRLER